MAKRPKIGDRVKWQSLDDTIAPTFGKITETSPSGHRAQVQWDDGETYQYDLTDPASCVKVLP